jgi:hypothetical protein
VHEVRLTVPPERVDDAVQAAHSVGIEGVTVTPLTIHRPKGAEAAVRVSVETSTPRARAFVRAVQRSPWFDLACCSMSTREVRAIVNGEPLDELTRPMDEPDVDVLQDLWQLSHVTASYVGRCVAGALLMARGVIANDLVALMLAVLFLPFLSEVRGLAYGLLRGDRSLAFHACKALAVTVITLLAIGAIAGVIDPSPIRYDGFKGLALSAVISFVIGAAAGLASADDAGRRYLIGVAAAAQLGVFPLYFGIALVRGFPASLPVSGYLLTFAVDFTTVVATTAASYAVVEYSYNRRHP